MKEVKKEEIVLRIIKHIAKLISFIFIAKKQQDKLYTFKIRQINLLFLFIDLVYRYEVAVHSALVSTLALCSFFCTFIL